MTIKTYSQEDLTISSSFWPETEGRKENENYIILDMVAIPKSEKYRSWTPLKAPTYRRGWGYPLPKEARFSTVTFTADRRGEKVAAVAVILKEPDEEIWVAWFRAEREAEARRIVDELNAEIDQIWRIWDASKVSTQAREDGAPSTRWLRFEGGHEFAPDSRWGAITLTIHEDGHCEYTRRQRGSLLESKEVQIAPERAAEIFGMLRRSTFPDVPAHKIPPGASLMRLSIGEGATTSEPLARAQLDFHFGTRLPQLGDVIQWMDDIAEAIRSDDKTTLDTWRSAP